MKRLLLLAITSLITMTVIAQDSASTEITRWLRHPAISPDGQTIAFGYMGNLYTVDVDGGVAIPLTVGDAYYTRPVWSNNGKNIAYSSDIYGNFDIFIMPATGGAAKQLTFHSTDDFAYDFTPDDSHLLFGSHREAPAESMRFPGVRYFANLYTIPITGGRPMLVSAAGAEHAHYNKAGTQIVFQDKKGYEDYYRKHHISPVTRDIWIYTIEDNSYREITSFKGEDRVPLFGNNGQTIYYLSEESGTLNVHSRPLEGEKSTQLTQFVDFPVRSLSIADDGTMAFTWKGDIYTLTAGEAARKITIKVQNNAGFNAVREKDLGRITEFKVSPSGKEVAFVSRGEIFVSGVDNSTTKRITNTPQQERMINWSPDGKSIIYSGERNGNWNIYKVEMEHPEEKFFFASTTLKYDEVVATEAQEFQAEYSPDGKKVAYVENRNVLKVIDLKSGEKTTILPKGHNYSYADGDWSFAWSPDSRWLLVDDGKGYFTTSNTALISLENPSNIVYPVNSGFGDDDAKWYLDGKMMTYESSKLGRKSLAYQGSHETDIYAVFFDREAYDKYTLSEDEYKLMKAREEDDKEKSEEDKKEKDKKEKEEKKEEIEPLEFDLENLEDRIVRLTINSASISDYVLNEDGSKLYYLAKFEKGYDLWVTEPRTRKTKILAKLSTSGSHLAISDDGKTIFLSDRGRLKKISTKDGKVKSISTDPEMMWNPQAERKYIFNHIWQQVSDKFYDPDIHGIDWKMYRDTYAQFLPYINNNYDFKVLLSEMLGELNASHTGARYYPSNSNAAYTHTASFGILYDQKYQGPGIKISEVLDGGPLASADSKLKAGDIIIKINNQSIAAGENWNKYLDNLIGKNTLLTFQRGKKTFQQTIKPISLGAEHNLMYERWVDMMERMTDSLSNGKLGYVHIRGMNDYSFRQVYDKVMGKYIDKEALIVDTRFNGGGWLHNDLNTFLSGHLYLKFAPQGHLTKGGEPVDRWTKPSVVVMSEGNYSDAFIFPYVYKQNGIGKLVGMPVAGTGTAVWWERQIDRSIIFGIPMVATIGDEGRPTENLTLHPDIKVPLPYGKFLNGEDTQLEAAVKVLLKEVDAEK